MRIQRRLIHSDVQPSTSFQFDPIRFFSALSSPIYWNFCADYQTHISSNEWMLSCMGRYQSMWCYVSVCVSMSNISLSFLSMSINRPVNIHSKYFEHKIFPLKRKTVIIDLLTPFTRWHINQLNINFQQLMSSHLNECNIVVIPSRKCCRWIPAKSNLWLSLCALS